jgi:hypothetical protein
MPNRIASRNILDRSHHIRPEEDEEAGQTILDSWRGVCGDEARQVMSWVQNWR